MPEQPVTSTVRAALAIRAAVDRLDRVPDGPDMVDAVATIMWEAKTLRMDQINELVAHLADAYPAERALVGTLETTDNDPAWPHHDLGNDQGDDDDDAREARRRAAADELAGRVHGDGD